MKKARIPAAQLFHSYYIHFHPPYFFLSRHAEVVVCSGSGASVTQRRGLSSPASELMRIHDYEITICYAAASLTCAVQREPRIWSVKPIGYEGGASDSGTWCSHACRATLWDAYLHDRNLFPLMSGDYVLTQHCGYCTGRLHHLLIVD